MQGKRRKSGAEVEQRPGRELSMKMVGGYKVQAPLTLLLVILIALTVKVTDQLDMVLYRLGPEGDGGEALHIQIIHSNI